MVPAKPVVLAAVLTLGVCVVHFVNSVYVPVQTQLRAVNIQTLTATPFVLPYKPEDVQSVIAQWRIVETPVSEPKIKPVASQLAGFDNAQLGDTTVALLAIYQQKKPVAVVALQNAGQDITYVRMHAGDSNNGITLSQLNKRDITLRHNDRQVKLQLFTPASAVTE